MDIPKKWWWVAAVVVPVVVAGIAIVPDLLRKGSGGGSDTFRVIGTQFNDEVTFNTVSLVIEQARQAGQELPDSLVETLHEAVRLAQDRQFEAAIPLLETVAGAAPVPALLNNVGAAYLAAGDRAKARGYFQQALADNPEEQTATVNLGQLDAPSPPVEVASGERVTSREVEPNNEILTPNEIELDTWVDALITDDADADYYVVTTPPVYRDIIDVTVENRSTTLRPRLDLYNQGKSHFYYNYDDTPGANLIHSFSVQPNSMLYAAVTTRGNQGAYRIRIAPSKAYDEYEPNDDILQAKPRSLGTLIDASIMDGSDADYFSFENSLGDSVTISLENRSTTLQPRLDVYNEAKSHFFYNYDDTPGANLTHTLSARPNATLYVAVTTRESPGAYRLTVNAK